MQNTQKFLDLIQLKAFKGYRTQMTFIVALVVNSLVQAGKITLEQADTINKFLIILAGLFFADKLSDSDSDNVNNAKVK